MPCHRDAVPVRSVIDINHNRIAIPMVVTFTGHRDRLLEKIPGIR